ncbi:CTP synthase, partial [Candidatus Woesearchaeota archaeon]|nr:CTP synthase [Candidatus Woesearchaeota archaeon]
ALREMRLEGEEVVFVHVSYLPVPGNLGEMKTKPTQRSVRDLNQIGIQPDFIVTRSSEEIDEPRRKKISRFCNVKEENIISSPDIWSVYQVPLVLDSQGFGEKVLKMLDMPAKKDMKGWKEYITNVKELDKEVVIGIVGKYFDIGEFTLEDSYISVIEAVKHACWEQGVKPIIRWIDSKAYEQDASALKDLDSIGGVIVPGGFGSSGVEGKITAIRYCRENKIPYLGLCYGMQLAVVEFARDVAGLEGAHTTEIDQKTKYPVIDILPEQKKLIEKSQYGATMRLGAYPAKLKNGTKVSGLYGEKEEISERHRHRYEVNPEFIEKLEAKGLVFSGASPDRRLMEFIELTDHPYFVATQAHPEFKSRFMHPAPLFKGLVEAAVKR